MVGFEKMQIAARLLVPQAQRPPLDQWAFRRVDAQALKFSLDKKCREEPTKEIEHIAGALVIDLRWVQ